MSRRSRSLTWIRINGQHELRENIRAAIKASPLTQTKAAVLAGMMPSRLTGFLAGNVWWTPEDVVRIVEILNAHGAEVDAVTLTGGSVFRTDPWATLDRFDFSPQYDKRGRRVLNPPAPADEEKPTETPTRGICCECGSIARMTILGPVDRADDGEETPGGRWVFDFDCKTCDRQTRHAVLRRDDEHRDHAERQDHRPTAEQDARRALDRFMVRLSTEFGADVRLVHRAVRSKKHRARGFAGRYEWDDSKSQWRIEVDRNLPASVQLEMLTSIWDDISRDNFDHLDWDVRDTGVVVAPPADDWTKATENLVDDIARFLDIERRKLVQDLNDRIDHDATGAAAEPSSHEGSSR